MPAKDAKETAAAKATTEAAAEKSRSASVASKASDSSSSSSSSESPSQNTKATAKALAEGKDPPHLTGSFAWERGPPAGGHATVSFANGPLLTTATANLIYGPGGLPLPVAVNAEVESFLAAAGSLEGDCAMRLRNLAPHLQRQVVERGPIGGSRNPTSVLICRIRDAELGRYVAPATLGLPPGQQSNPEVERFIQQWSLDIKASVTLRGLPLEQQKAAVQIQLKDARNPSAYFLMKIGDGALAGAAAFATATFGRQTRDSTSVAMASMRMGVNAAPGAEPVVL